jgi:adenosylcobinamide-GDP ribazoletransferase
MFRSFLIALQFLTRVPVSFRRAPDAAETSASLLYYPLVGLLIGIVLSGLAWLLGALSPLLAAAILLCTWVLLTGGLHLDGLADSADAWAGGRGDRERMLRIMKDPASGPIGVTALVLVLLLKFTALATLLEARAYWLFSIAPLLGRTALPLLFVTTPYVRSIGLGTPFAKGIPRRLAIGIGASAYLLVLVLYGLLGLGAVLAGLATFALLRLFMTRQLGGTTGDTAGALVELSETAVLLSVAVIVSLSVR